jgi:RNA polymerase sigma-70 factor (ECF subfamily)
LSRPISSRDEQPANAEPRRFRDLFLANKRDLFGFLVRKVGVSDAPDLLQETFLRMIRHERSESIVDPPAFLKRIAINLARDYMRRRRVEESRLQFGDYLIDPPTDETPIEERLEYERRSALLKATIETLPPRCREVFELHIYDDLPLKEIARRMDISDRMARKHVSLALRACRAALRSAIE